MQTDIYYRDIRRTENLESFLLEKVEGAIENFLKYDSAAHLTVRVEHDRHRTDNRKPSYTCEVVLKPTHTRRVFKVRKSDEDFNVSLNKTVQALKRMLSNRSSRKADHRRRDPVLTIVPSLEVEESVTY